jgi:acyl-CoA hydrolase
MRLRPIETVRAVDTVRGANRDCQGRSEDWTNIRAKITLVILINLITLKKPVITCTCTFCGKSRVSRGSTSLQVTVTVQNRERIVENREILAKNRGIMVEIPCGNRG